MIRAILTMLLLAAVAWAATSVPLGSRTLWGHLSAIWSTPEAKEMQAGIKEAATPALEKMRRGAEAGIHAANTTPVDVAPAAGRDADLPPSTTASKSQVAALSDLRRAQGESEQGHHGEAAALAERAFTKDVTLAEAAMLAVVSYCKADNKLGAQRMAKELGATARKSAAAVCDAEGIALGDG